MYVHSKSKPDIDRIDWEEKMNGSDERSKVGKIPQKEGTQRE